MAVVAPAPIDAPVATAVPNASDLRAVLVVRNNQDLAYAGPLELRTSLPAGHYSGPSAVADVRDSVVRLVVSLDAGAQVILRPDPTAAPRVASVGLAIEPSATTIALDWQGKSLGALDLALVVIPGSAAAVGDAVRAFRPLDISWTKPRTGGAWVGTATRDGYAIFIETTPYAGGWIDTRASVVRTGPAGGPAYVAVVRRLTAGPVESARLRFNGRSFDGADSPDLWDRDFIYVRGVDWISWRAGTVALAATSVFSAVPTIPGKGGWTEGSHFYVWERTRRTGDGMYLISEIAGPNPEQAKRGMPITQYAPLGSGDTVRLAWRIAVGGLPLAAVPDATAPAGAAADVAEKSVVSPGDSWAEAQLRGFAGYRAVTTANDTTVVDVGVRGVSFGTSYFPYSTFAENFDYYRSPGLNQETWWPIAPALWAKWRAFIPRMRTDLYLIRASGFEWVRLHHLELLQQMPRDEAFAFLDWYVGQARELGMLILMDSEGPPEWMGAVAARYPDMIRRVEIENEVLIPGVKPGSAERWTAAYRAVKAASPNAQVYLTDAGNHGQFERLRQLGVPFDRVGLHAYKHGPQWKEAFASHALGSASYAASIGKEVTLGEFNWKELTRLSPEARRDEVAKIYRQLLSARSIPELFEFHFQETMSVNPSIGRTGVRHYEPFSLDRRVKLEGQVLLDAIRQFSRSDAPIREVGLRAPESRFRAGRATAAMHISNRTTRSLDLHLEALSFDGTSVTLASPTRISLAPGEGTDAQVVATLPNGARRGTYHYFVRAAYDGHAALGAGVAANVGAPVFAAAPVLGDRVRYPQGAAIVNSIDWTRPIAVTFGRGAPVLEMEMAYMLANTLQSATGTRVYLSSAEDLPDSLARGATTLVLVGTPATNPAITTPAQTGTAGVVLLSSVPGGGKRLIITGADKAAVEAAATDVVLRFWPNAKDSSLRIGGMEPGAALGHKAGLTTVDPP